MNNYIERMEAELAELKGRADKAVAFIGTATWAELATVDQELLSAQVHSMRTYEHILGLRLDRAKQLALPL
jgi:hypothetical protein